MITLALCAAIVAVLAGIAQSASGFGMALIAIPLLLLFTDVQTAVVGITMLGAVLTTGASIRYRREADWPIASKLSLAAIVGMPLGLVVLSLVESTILTGVIALLVLAFTWFTWRGVSIKQGRVITLGTGLVSGALLTSTGMNGPPLVASLQAMGVDKNQLRATLQATFAAQDLVAVLGFWVVGQLSLEALVVAASGLPGVVLGWVLGDLVFRRVSPTQFKGILLLVLLACAATLLVQTITSFYEAT